MSTTKTDKSYFRILAEQDVNENVKKKGELTYLSWVWAWGKVKEYYPDANYKVYENADGWNYHTDGRTCWVKCSVTINELEHIEYLPVMNFRNASIPVKDVTSIDVNKAIQRCITKACARHGLGLYIYAGEDLPMIPNDEDAKPYMDRIKKAKTQQELRAIFDELVDFQSDQKFRDDLNKRAAELKNTNKK